MFAWQVKWMALTYAVMVQVLQIGHVQNKRTIESVAVLQGLPAHHMGCAVNALSAV